MMMTPYAVVVFPTPPTSICYDDFSREIFVPIIFLLTILLAREKL